MAALVQRSPKHPAEPALLAPWKNGPALRAAPRLDHGSAQLHVDSHSRPWFGEKLTSRNVLEMS